MSEGSEIKTGDAVIYITRSTKIVKTGNDRSISYAQEIVYRGIWDGEQAVMYEKFDPRKLMAIVRNKEWLIKV